MDISSFFQIFLTISYIIEVKSVVPEYCLSPLNRDDCHAQPRSVFSYYKPGSRCEIEVWRGCPTLNSFPTELDCIRRCIFSSKTEPKIQAELPYHGSYHDNVGIPEAVKIKQRESRMNFRIIGGNATREPYMVGLLIMLETYQTSICSGVMFRRNRALTAAHCWRHGKKQAIYFEVVFGSECLYCDGHHVVTKDVALHPEYDAVYLVHDIAIMHYPAVKYTDTIRRLYLPRFPMWNNTFRGDYAKASGYGRTGDGEDHPYDKDSYSVMLRVISNQRCKTYLIGYITEASLCTSGKHWVGTCKGDSGGPLVITNNSRNILIGITSYGDSVCKTTKPSVYTRVTHVMPWIIKNLANRKLP